MRITFLCSSFEAGRDGVGDYVHQFATFLGRKGHNVQVIALADRFVEVPTERAAGAASFEVLRVPARAWFQGDISMAEQALGRFRPDWVSLQMVCYGYGKSGLLLGPRRAFARLRSFGQHRHMMFHELWIGEADSYGPRQRALGWAQKRLLLRVVRSWHPAAAHTSNPVYRELLHRNGVHAEELPLPGNIPIIDMNGLSARQWLLEKLGVDRPAASPLVAGVFGALHPEWARSVPLHEIERICAALGRSLIVVHFGRAGSAGDGAWNELGRKLSSRIPLLRLGELPAEEISRVLQGLDLAIATSPWPLVGKSGTVAAMVDHGVPVLVTATSYRLRHGETPGPIAHHLLHRFDDTFAAKLASGAIRRGIPHSREDMYVQFTEALEKSTDARNAK